MTAIKDYFSNLLALSAKSNHRYGVVLQGSEHWQTQCLDTLFSLVASKDVFFLGGDSKHEVEKHVGYKKGQQLLGQECLLLCCDFRDGFDANSFTAATGCVRGGGLVIILPEQTSNPTLAHKWLDNAFRNLIVVEEGIELSIPQSGGNQADDKFKQQNQAIEKILKVVGGHRKRPLVMTADRGRGKSSALGIAAAKLMQERSIHIVVTAPSLATVQPVFEHAQRLLPQVTADKGRVQFQQSVLEFVAPDELLRSQQACDCLFVDEASAIPIPMLKTMVEQHHRAVFSTTIHGYEGCGRGFTVKFQTWLKQQRPGAQFFHLDAPIRWNVGDPLERWLFDAFLLDADLSDVKQQDSLNQLIQLDKQMLVDQPSILRRCFALLVNAHYQTSPNDLMLLLEDDAIQLHAILDDDQCLGCMLTVEEGKLTPELVEQVQLGKRRPRGHLVPSLLANQLGMTEAALQSSQRIMRIAVHPSMQRAGIGKAMIKQLIQSGGYDFYSTSFGATAELVDFWRSCGFTPAKLGSQREQASGTYSLVMVNGGLDWRHQIEDYFDLSFQFAVGETYRELEIELVRSLLTKDNASVEKPNLNTLVKNYCHGGASFDSVVPLLDLWWKSSPHILANMSDLFIRKVVQRRDWQWCAKEFGFAGSKQIEQEFRVQLLSSITSGN